jgi:hypothetical protein
MSVRKLLNGMILLCCLIVGAIVIYFKSKPADLVFGRTIPLSAEEVSVINLVASPERYHGKVVVASGFVRTYFEGVSDDANMYPGWRFENVATLVPFEGRGGVGRGNARKLRGESK